MAHTQHRARCDLTKAGVISCREHRSSIIHNLESIVHMHDTRQVGDASEDFRHITLLLLISPCLALFPPALHSPPFSGTRLPIFSALCSPLQAAEQQKKGEPQTVTPLTPMQKYFHRSPHRPSRKQDRADKDPRLTQHSLEAWNHSVSMLR